MTFLEMSYKTSEGNAFLEGGQNTGAVRVNQSVGTSDLTNEQSSSKPNRDPEVSLTNFFGQH
jgi:hypothetical protein